MPREWVESKKVVNDYKKCYHKFWRIEIVLELSFKKFRIW